MPAYGGPHSGAPTTAEGGLIALASLGVTLFLG